MIEPVSFPPIELTPELEADSRKRPYIFGEGGGVAEAMFAEIDRLRAELANRDRQLAELRNAIEKVLTLKRHYPDCPIAVDGERCDCWRRDLTAALLPPPAKEEARENK